MEIKFIVLCVTVLVLFEQVCSYRILGIFPHIGKSHSYAFDPLMRSLAAKGHEVTVISHFPLEKPLKNYRDISLKGSIPIWIASFDLDTFSYPYIVNKVLTHIVIAAELTNIGISTCEAMLKNSEVQAIKQGEYDLVIIEEFNSDCGLGIINRLKVPFIGITSHVMMSWTYGRLGINTNPSYVISHYLGFGRSPNMLETAESLVVGYWYRLIFYLFSQRSDRALIIEHYDKDCPCLEEVARNMSMIMVYTYFPLMGAVPFAPNVLEIGGIHLQKPKPMKQDLEKYLNESKNGVILFSMGSMLRAISWPEDKLKAFQEAFAELEEDVLWKWENDTMEGVPKNVRLEKWVPQVEVLNHKNVKAFITHAGMLGLTEAVDSGVPVVSIPMYGDQFGNAAAARDSGVGAYLEYRYITKETVLEALRAVLKPSILQKAKKLSAIWKDRPMPPLETAVYWVEHVARHGGSHLRPVSADLPFYRYLLLDVFAFFAALGILIIYINLKLYRFVKYLCCSPSKKSKKD